MKGRNKNQLYRISGKLKSFMMWPVYIGVVLVILTIAMYIVNKSCGNIMLAFMLVYAVFYAFMLLYLKPGIMHEMIEFSSNYS